MDGRDGDRSNVGLLLELDSTIKAIRKQLDFLSIRMIQTATGE